MRAILLYDGQYASAGKRVRIVSVPAAQLERGYVAVRYGFHTFQTPWWSVHTLDDEAEQVKQQARFEELRQ